MPDPTTPKPGKSPAVALALTFFLYFLPGIGQMYAGRFRRALVLFLATLTAFVALMWIPPGWPPSWV